MTTSSRRFVFDYHVKILPHEGELALWLPAPRTDAYQQVLSTRVSSPVLYSSARDPVHRNRILHVVLPGSPEECDVAVRYEIERSVRQAPSTPPRDTDLEDETNLSRYLEPDSRVPIDGPVVEDAVLAVSRDASPRDRARHIFDNLLATLSYDSAGCTPDRAHELGDLAVACDIKRGTCTEFHGLFVAQARALGIPARFAFGFNIPKRPEGRIAGYHCWSEVFLPETGWFAVDVSEAWKRTDPAERAFYFGNLDANRVQFTTGRDIALVPPQRTGPVDRFIFPLAELDGQAIDLGLKFSFADVAQPAGGQ